MLVYEEEVIFEIRRGKENTQDFLNSQTLF